MPSLARGGSVMPNGSTIRPCRRTTNPNPKDASSASARHVYLDGRWQHPTCARESRYSDFAPSTYDDDITIFSRILDYARSFLVQLNGRHILQTTISTLSVGHCSRGSPPAKDIEMIVSTPSPTLHSTTGISSGNSCRPRSSRNGSRRFPSSVSPRTFARSQPSAASSSPTLVSSSNTKTYSSSVASSQTISRTTVDAGTQYSPPTARGASALREVPLQVGSGVSPMVKKEWVEPPPEPALAPKRSARPATTDSGPGNQSTVSIAAAPPTTSSASSSSASSSSSSSNDSVRSTGALARSSGDISATSPTKRQRTLPRPPKMLPANYANCPAQDLASIISSMLVELVRINDKIPLKSKNLTRFHSRAPPTISVADYLTRLTTHATLSPPILLSMVYYIDRLCSLYDAFTISSLTVHRFLITAATVASKGLSDSFWTNNTYSRVGGVTMKELALLELEFLWRVEWKIVPKPEDLEDYYRSLVSRSEDYKIEGSSVSSGSRSGSGSGSDSGRSHKSGASSGRSKRKKAKGKEREKAPDVDGEKPSSPSDSMKVVVMDENQ